MARGHRLKIGRVYDAPDQSDGVRVLMDRLWPRGLSERKAHLNAWCTLGAPSTALRSWYQHDPKKVDEFVRRYRFELQEPEHPTALAHLRDLSKEGPVLLLTASRQPDISEVAVLAELLHEPTTQ